MFADTLSKEMALNDEKFSLFLKDPVISRTQKTSIIQEIMQAQKFSDLTVNFFGLFHRYSLPLHLIDSQLLLLRTTVWPTPPRLLLLSRRS